jgi:glycosyltransferase involved in cell wall biosynthesis
MPCLNEAETLAQCIEKARTGLAKAGVTGEILIADNGSTDSSIEIAEKLGARVIPVAEKGYGSALRGGIEAADSRWIIMGDADDSYDFSDLNGFVEKLRAGFDLVMGCRLPIGGGTIMPGAMPWKNRWIGNPILSTIGRTFFKCPAHDFHCGLRGFTKEAYVRLDLKTTGMEFASEMVIKATLHGEKIAEAPITLHPDGRSRPPHLRPWRDGWRHLRFMLIYSPRWLFLIPGLVLMILSLIAAAALFASNWKIAGVSFDVGTFIVAAMGAIVGLQLVCFAFFTKVFAIAEGLLPADENFSRLFDIFSLERGAILGAVLKIAGVGVLLWSVWRWKEAGYGQLPYEENVRRIVAAVTLIVIGIQVISASFFVGVLGLKTTQRKPAGPDAE